MIERLLSLVVAMCLLGAGLYFRRSSEVVATFLRSGLGPSLIPEAGTGKDRVTRSIRALGLTAIAGSIPFLYVALTGSALRP